MVDSGFPAVGIGRFCKPGGAPFAALAVDGAAHPLADVAGADTIALFERWADSWPQLQARIAAIRAAREPGIPLADLQTLPPVRPRQIFCAGANYRQHVIDIMTDHDVGSDQNVAPEVRRANAIRIMNHRATAGSPYMFVKPISALAGPFDTLTIPADSAETDWELELAVVIGKPARRVPRTKAMAHVAGYVIANDISARDRIARRDIPSMGLDFLVGKGMPGFLPLGPVIVPAALAGKPEELRITLSLNDQVMQNEAAADMIFPIPRLIEFLSTHIQLLPGDVICTGSPAGNGTHYGRYLREGDIMRGAISGLGAQLVPCRKEVVADGAVLHQPFAPLD